MFSFTSKQKCRIRDAAQRTSESERLIAIAKQQRIALQEEINTMLNDIIPREVADDRTD